MRNIPPKVLKTFERMKKKEPSHVELKIIKNNYYVYRATSEWDKERKKVRKITEYIGSIDHGGIFRKKRERHGFESLNERFLSMEMAHLPII